MSVAILEFIKKLPVRSILAFQKAMDAVTEHYYHYQEPTSAHPSVQLFLKHFSPYRYLNVLDESLSDDTQSMLLNELRNAIDDFVDDLDSRQHRKQLRNLSRSRARNNASLNTYVNTLFKQHAKLLVIRVDLHYNTQVTPETALADRERYLRAVKRRFDHLLGYIWKLEYGASRGFHYHMCFLFNGAKRQGDRVLGQLLGEQWVALTEDGSYHNCNARRDKYQSYNRDGLGNIQYSDLARRDNLLFALDYLTKHDDAVLAELPERYRTFGKMELPEWSAVAGRPRHY